MRRAWLTGMLTGVAAAVGMLALGQRIWAQGALPPTGRVACVNVMQVLNEYQRQKDLTEELSALQDKLAAEDKKRRDSLDTLQAEIDRLDRDDPTLLGRLREMRALSIDYKNWRDLVQLNTAQEYSIWMVRIYKEFVKATEEVARSQGYDLVLYRSEFEQVSMDPQAIQDQIRNIKLIYANPGVDITQAVLDRLNKDYRSQPRVPMIQTTP